MFLYIFKRIISFKDDMLPNFFTQESNSKYFNDILKYMNANHSYLSYLVSYKMGICYEYDTAVG